MTRNGYFSGSAVETNMSMPGRSDLPSGFDAADLSNFLVRTERLVVLLIGANLGN